MKTKTIIAFCSCLLLYSCDIKRETKYSIVQVDSVPDSLKQAQCEFIVNLTKAASEHMTGGDYEDVDETIQEAYNTSVRCFSTKIFALQVEPPQTYGYIVLPEAFSNRERYIFDSLMTNDTGGK